jgi:hypothetical protein
MTTALSEKIIDSIIHNAAQKSYEEFVKVMDKLEALGVEF